MSDVEKAEWIAGTKGAYNASDLNRVGEAVRYLADEARNVLTNTQAYLKERNVADDVIFHPYAAEDVLADGKTDWEYADVPTPDEMESYLENIRNLRGLLDMPSNTPDVPTDMEGFTFNEANDIETILVLVEAVQIAYWKLTQNRINYISGYENRLNSGTFYAGANRTLQHFSRGR